MGCPERAEMEPGTEAGADAEERTAADVRCCVGGRDVRERGERDTSFTTGPKLGERLNRAI
jgi:hypothetical protein